MLVRLCKVRARVLLDIRLLVSRNWVVIRILFPGSTEDSKEPSKMFKRQTRSRRASVSSNENGSLTRDGQLSDMAFVEQLEDFRRQLLDLRKDKKKQEDEIIKYKLLCKEKHQTIGVGGFRWLMIIQVVIEFSIFIKSQ